MPKKPKPVDLAKVAKRQADFESRQTLLNLASNMLRVARDEERAADLDFAALRGRVKRLEELRESEHPCGWTRQQNLDEHERKLVAAREKVRLLTNAVAWLNEQ